MPAFKRFAALILTSAALSAVAADEEEIVVVGERSALEPGASSTLDTEVIQRVRPTHANELLSRVPGVWVSRGSGQEHLTAIRSGVLTGAGACGEFLFLENALPIRPHGFCNVNNLFEVNLAQAASVEVLRGPASARLGGNALHGAINAVTLRPGDGGSGASIEAGPYGYGQARFSLDGARFRLDAVGTHTDGYRDDTGFGEQKLSAAWLADLGGFEVYNTLTVTNLNQETGGFVLGEDAFEDSGLQDSNPNPEAYRDAFALRAASHWSKTLGDGRELTITPYARRSQMTFLQHFLPGQPTEKNDQTSWGATASLSGGDAVRWRVGGQLEWMEAGLSQIQEGVTVGSAFLVATRPPGVHYDFDVDSNYVALAGNLEGDVGQRASWWLSGRVERLEYDYDNDALVGRTRDDGTACGFGGCLYQRPADRSDDFTEFAIEGGWRWQLNESSSAYIALASGFRPPQATELYRLQRDQTVADLDAQGIESLEIGFARTGERLTLDVALYLERTSDVIFRDSAGFNVSDGETRSEGVEIDLVAALNDRHRLALAATWARHRYDFTRAAGGGEQIQKGNDVDTAPRVLANLRWLARFNARIDSELEVAVQSSSYLNAANTQRYDGHTLVNWRVDAEVSERLSVFGRVVNLLDTEYAERADFAFGNFRYFPGMPRQFYVGAELSF